MVTDFSSWESPLLDKKSKIWNTQIQKYLRGQDILSVVGTISSILSPSVPLLVQEGVMIFDFHSKSIIISFGGQAICSSSDFFTGRLSIIEEPILLTPSKARVHKSTIAESANRLRFTARVVIISLTILVPRPLVPPLVITSQIIVSITPTITKFTIVLARLHPWNKKSAILSISPVTSELVMNLPARLVIGIQIHDNIFTKVSIFSARFCSTVEPSVANAWNPYPKRSIIRLMRMVFFALFIGRLIIECLIFFIFSVSFLCRSSRCSNVKWWNSRWIFYSKYPSIRIYFSIITSI